jgi:hypothetical protein
VSVLSQILGNHKCSTLFFLKKKKNWHALFICLFIILFCVPLPFSLFYTKMQENPLERRRSIGRESFTGIDIPADIFMLDVSADETRMAVIYKASSVEEEEAEEGQERYMLILYDLPTEANGKKAAQNKEFKERDVSFIMTSTKPTYIFLSCSGQSGYVALSFMEIHFNGQPTNNPSDLLSTCYIYGNRVSPKEITFQGRAVFTKTKLALVGCNTVDIYSVFADNVIKKVYTLDIEMLSQGYEAATYHSDFIKELSWAKLIPNGPIRTISVAGHCIITMSRLIRYNILITQYGDCNGGIVRIWSIIDGTLLISYRSKNVEHVLAISDNYRYIATYNEDDMTARIYCTKTSVVLHTIPIRTEADRQDRYTPSYMRFFGDGRYLIISGFEPNTEPPLEYRNYCFDFWCVPAHKLLLTHETRVYESALLPFVMEFQNSSSKYAETTPITNELKNGDTRKLDRHYNLAEVRAIYTIKTGRRSTLITTKTLFEQDGIYSLDKIPWNWRGSSESDPQETTSCKITLLMKPGERYMARFCMRPELNDPLNEFKNLLCYSIQMGTDYYILRFGLYTVQLWRLIEMGPNASEADKSQKGFQLEGSPYFYKSMEANELVYIRTYKATDYETGLTFKMDWRIRVELGFPKVSFMDETGHIYVEIEHQNLRKFLRTFEKTWPISPITKNEKLTYKFVHVDEIFLPILKAPSVSTNNRFSTIDSTGDSTNSDFHEIESACRELCHINDTNEVRYLCREEATLPLI